MQAINFIVHFVAIEHTDDKRTVTKLCVKKQIHQYLLLR